MAPSSLATRPPLRSPVVVTGATGFLGGALLTRLLALDYPIRAVTRRAGPLNHPGLDWLELDLNDQRVDLAAAVEDAGAVIHLAWSSVPHTANVDPVRDLNANVPATLRLAEAASRAGARFLFASSGGTVYGRIQSAPIDEDHPTRPTSFYGLSKLTAERYLDLYCTQRGLDLIVLRFSNVYGPGQVARHNFGAIASFAERAVRGDEIAVFGDGSTIRDYLYLGDAIDALIRAISAQPRHRIINVGSGVGASITEVLRAVEGAAGMPLIIRSEPARSYDVPVNVLNIERAVADLGWRPKVSLEEGVRRTVHAWQAVQV